MNASTADKFVHLIYEYRYLAIAGRAWNHFGPHATHNEQAEANRLQPGIAVLIQDSLLVHARLLIDFYTKPRSTATDIVIGDFGFPALSETLCKRLDRYKNPIEVHLLHLTSWRDRDFRSSQRATVHGRERQRIDWNRHNDRIVTLLVGTLNTVSRRRADQWHQPFQHLHHSVNAVLHDSEPDLPAELLEKDNVMAYLESLGLA